MREGGLYYRVGRELLKSQPWATHEAFSDAFKAQVIALNIPIDYAHFHDACSDLRREIRIAPPRRRVERREPPPPIISPGEAIALCQRYRTGPKSMR